MTDIDNFEKDITLLLDTCTQELKNIKKKDPSQRLKQINRCQDKAVEINTRIEDYELEILQLDKIAQVPYREKLRKLQQRYKELRTELNAKKAEATGDTQGDNPLTEGLLSKNRDDMKGESKLSSFY